MKSSCFIWMTKGLAWCRLLVNLPMHSYFFLSTHVPNLPKSSIIPYQIPMIIYVRLVGYVGGNDRNFISIQKMIGPEKSQKHIENLVK